MISSVCWVPRGAAKAVPQRVEPTEEELLAAQNAVAGVDLEADGGAEDEELEDEEDEKEEDMDVEAEVAQAKAAAAALTDRMNAGGSSIEDALRELDLDNYDVDEEDAEAAMVSRILGAGERGGLAYYASNEEDPYIAFNDDSASEIEDLTLKPSDLVIMATRHEDDVSALEVWIYEEGETTADGLTTGSNSYVHHDIMLPAFPLCMAWINCDVSGRRDDGRANLVAVGTMDVGIEIWDLDVVDVVEPTALLGGEERGRGSIAVAGKQEEEGEAAAAQSGKKKKKKSKKQKAKKLLRPDSHEDSVLGLAWNAEFRNVLASCSADTTVKLWDLSTQKCEHTLRHHKGKVQAVAWNPAEAPVLLSGAFDRSVCVTDMRQPSSASASWSVTSDVEALCWLPHIPTSFLVSSDDGLVACFDARGGAGSKPLFSLSAHDKATCALSFCPAAEGLLATASTDKKVKLWDLKDQKPSLVATQDLKAGAVFSLSFSHDAPHLLAVGGSMGALSVWDIRCNAAVATRYPNLRLGASAALKLQDQEQ